MKEGGLNIFDAVQEFFENGGFAAFGLSLLVSYDLLLVGLLLTPGGESGIGSLAEELRVWCFGYNPATGELEWAYVFSMLLPPVLLAGFLAMFWWGSLKALLRRPLIFARYAIAAFLLVGGAGVSFALLAEPAEPGGEFPFPAEAIRTSILRPKIALMNQDEQHVDIAELQGKVVVLTAVYASCGHTCPLILTQAKNAIGNLKEEERADLRLVAVTLDPENDSPGVLAMLAEGHGLNAPLYNLLTGESAEVEDALDAIGVVRERDPETGVINHSNQFVLVDRSGKVAYRLGLGEQQERWLEDAMRVLLSEAVQGE